MVGKPERKLDPKRCQEEVWQKDGGWTMPYKQCSRKGVVEEDGKLWCKQHAPSARERRREVLDEAYRERQREEKRRREYDAWRRVLADVEGKDPALAIELRRFGKKHGILD